MTTNLSRRDLIKGMSIVPIAGVFALQEGCTSAQATQFINLLDDVTLAVQGALPIISLFTPAPYNLLLPVIAGFINLANTAASSTATELASMDSALIQSEKILNYWASVVLDPSVLAKLPTNVNNINTQALIQALVTYINNLLSQIAATIPGTSVSTTTQNAIVSVSAPTALMRRVLSNSKPFNISFFGKMKLHRIIERAKKNADKLSGK